MHKEVNLSLKWFFLPDSPYQDQILITACLFVLWCFLLTFLFSALWCSTRVIGSVYFPFGITWEILDALQMHILGFQIFSLHIKWTRNTSFSKGKEDSHSENAFFVPVEIPANLCRGLFKAGYSLENKYGRTSECPWVFCWSAQCFGNAVC